MIRLAERSHRIIFAALLVAAALLLTGCGAKLTAYDYTEDGVRYNMYELELDGSTVEKMEKTATASEDGTRYTVDGYFYELFRDFGYELVGAARTDEKYVARYRKAVPADGGELFELGTRLEFSVTHTENPFIRTYEQTAENPFNGVRAAYDAVQPLRSSTVLERIKNGAVARDEFGELVVSQPALEDAFPYLRGVDPDGLRLDYVRYGTSRMSSSGRAVRAGDNRSAYVFSRYFDTTSSEIAFTYKRAVPYGWYLVALAVGGTVLALIVFFTRQKKQKPTLLDRFPYNPEEYRDYESHLPTKL